MISLVEEGNITNEPLTREEIYRQQLPIAIFIFLYCTMFIFLYVVVLMALRSEREYKSLTAYRIMFHIGVADIVQLCIHFTAGIYIIIGKERYGVPEQIIGAFMNAAWCTMLALTILLTLNRFTIIIFAFRSKEIFSNFMTNVYLGLCWLFFGCIVAANLSPLSRFYYVVPLYTWHYQSGYPLSHPIRTMSAQLSVAEVVVAIVAYGTIFAYIYLKAAILSKKEVYLTIQVLAMGAFHLIGFLIWEYWFLPDTVIATFFAHFVWMLWNSMNPILHLTISPRIRNNALVVLKIRKFSSTEVSILAKGVTRKVSTIAA